MRRLSSVFVGVALASCAHATGVSPIPPGAAYVHRLPARAATYKQLYSFGAFPGDGNSPTMDLVQPSAGLPLYGTTYGGGSPSSRCKTGCGTVYTVDPTNGSETVVWSFTGRPDGAVPEAGISAVNGTIYGTTFFGGLKKNQCYTGRGCGTVFRIKASRESVLYSFRGGLGDGSNPAGSLHVIDGAFYGTTEYGGAHGFGTLFKLSLSGRETILYSFGGGPADGAYPIGTLLISKGRIYGVTSRGGAANVGTVFRVDPHAKPDQREAILHSFTRAEGDFPAGINSTHGTIYGTASADGANNRGSIFSMTPSGAHFHVLHYFKGTPKSDGALPYTEPTFYKNVLYGTTQGGGEYSSGTIYCMNLTGNREEHVLHNFRSPKGVRPDAPLRQWGGLFYGTTVEGGANGLGTVYRLSPVLSCTAPGQ